MDLNNIHTPRDLKKFKIKELEGICGDIRALLIGTISKTGGHLASNLGVVELTVALHTVFNVPSDKIIWDVGHQSYVHKILTGRARQFSELRRKNGLSGFPKSDESPCDAFNTGHASTSISAAVGYCAARDLREAKYNVVAVIGDGSMTGGLAYEAINNAGRSSSKLLVILNDNQMSISENVGALSRYLNEVRTAPAYIGAKADVSRVLDRIPVVGRRLKHFIERTKDGIKYLLAPGGIFEELGFTYIGPVDGHNLKDLIGVLQKVKKMDGPVLLHVYTVKGKGYDQAEDSPENYHGVDSFHVDTGKPVAEKKRDTYSDVLGKTLIELAEKHPKLTAITAAMPMGVGFGGFSEKFPDRMFDVGIAEEHAVTFAAGLAKGGVMPVVAIYSTFLQRAFDQILHDVCMQDLHVVFAVDRAGIIGADGETHQGLFDISFLWLPNMTILAPINEREMIDMIRFAFFHTGPIAVRYPKGSVSRVLTDHSKPIVYGKSDVIRVGEDFVILAVGSMMEQAYRAVERLNTLGYNPGLINVRFVKPIDIDMARGLSRYRHVFVLEEHVISGGFGSHLLSVLNEENIDAGRIHRFALPDIFVEHGTRIEILKQYSLDYISVTDRISKLI
ncbi:MAG: 1-deoxy-D-xylulose-5-phosphate synthase [Clostridiales bacterium]|jgi:1-deoxy-D-xylulose-5-phosphate synthase|nr:1-deoxy-D-xylulose-5-phosphate synthase [Clostridiales bacterium]